MLAVGNFNLRDYGFFGGYAAVAYPFGYVTGEALRISVSLCLDAPIPGLQGCSSGCQGLSSQVLLLFPLCTRYR